MRIEVEDLWYKYPSGTEALRGISLCIDGMAPTAIIGQNGAGKTTLIRHFNGLLIPTRGSVRLDGVHVRSRSVAQWARHVGYVFQNPDDQLFLDSVSKELAFGPQRLGWPRERIQSAVEDAAHLVGLQGALGAHPYDLPPTRRRLVAIGSIITMDPAMIILDEPTTGQDARGTQRLAGIIEKLREKGKQMIAVSHDMNFVARCFERVIVMAHGQVLLDGSTRAVFGQPDVLAKSWVSPPPATRVAQAVGASELALDVDECANAILRVAARGTARWEGSGRR